MTRWSKSNASQTAFRRNLTIPKEPAAETIQPCGADVAPQAHVQEQARFLSILTHVTKSQRDGVSRRTYLDALAGKENLARSARPNTEQGQRRLGAARSCQTRQSDNLSGARLERNVLQKRSLRSPDDWIGQALYFQQH